MGIRVFLMPPYTIEGRTQMQDTTDPEHAPLPTQEPTRIAHNAVLPTIDVASRLQCSTKHVGDLARAGKLPCLETRLGRLFRAEDVEKLVEERAAAPRDMRGHVRALSTKGANIKN